MSDNSWLPSASIQLLRARAGLIGQIRQFFNERHYLEVETPVMARHGVTDIYLSNIKAIFRGETYYLQTSPEYHMKRLLAAGSGPIFQLARVFRDDELGRWHNPEFTLLEWYQLNIDHHVLMDEVDLLLQIILKSQPMTRKTYQQVFEEACGIDPFSTSIEQLNKILVQHDLDGVLFPQEQDRDQYLFLLMSHVVEPFLAQESSPVAVYHFPASQAALAQVNESVAERFEVYYQGVELANGFHELTDVEAQKKRFMLDQQHRKQKGLTAMEADAYLLEALDHGLPPCSGVALGVDRLLALALKQSSIEKVLSFDFSRA
ncbi:elongation factor P--(R)-beta-lysine ligase [Legionella pneumophila]|uniref:Lysyl-tRNA synthetase, class II n=1 Tax=Legionella pneumophila subsp. pascullei TaxID=91890 RepID=A0AAX2ISH6_LEGPN|nr:elongation factor P--(R)-beta-lysine ligase [Legionella pneumophila]AMP90667.1 EF-P lysine aminoacylase GenX [Legionella pneumophila subsp. pascullei]AMP91643.1 poxB regulator PoxA [Legionella pneumophila subsp. pascullei]AMP94629.1 poxB regulator PoxA [Legionella pneumophila subsp. pascullei]SQG89441.1 lysyl-tRNA synthetase, class II [Legionella pneumophila subsp. pascullei]VEH04717.1 lysyl-tRNA synthetase, class II [Legionella pneumophila subsp. pascullei]